MPHILLVDDDKDLLMVTMEYLKQEDPSFEFVLAISAYEALAKMAETKFVAIVSDYQMPGMDGLELLKRIRDEYNDIPFIMFTGRGREEVAVRALNLGADYYLTKGIEPTSLYGELAHIISRVIEHRQTEHALRESEQKYRELVEKLHEGVLVENAAEVITFVNPRTSELLGYSIDELIGQLTSFIIPEKESEKIREETAKRSLGISSTYEATLQAKDRNLIHVIISPTPLFSDTGTFRGVLSVFTDITERKKVEELLERSERDKSLILANTADLILYSDRDLVVKWANQASGDSVNSLPDDLVGRHCYEIWHQRNEPCVFCPVVKSMETGQIQEAEIVSPDGRFYHIRGVPVREDNGTIVGAVEIAREVTKYKEKEEALNKTNTLLRLQKKELSEFTQTLSHNLGNRLHDIEGYAGLFLKKQDEAYVTRIQTITQNMAKILHRSVALAEAGLAIGKTVEVDTKQLIQEAAETVIPEKITLIIRDLSPVIADPEKLSQIFQNLLENAVIHGEPSIIEVKQHISETGLSILITNNGKPIPKEHRTEVFQRGFTTKKRSGLGLTIVKKLVQAHNWQIYLEDAPETTFSIFFPIKAS